MKIKNVIWAILNIRKYYIWSKVDMEDVQIEFRNSPSSPPIFRRSIFRLRSPTGCGWETEKFRIASYLLWIRFFWRNRVPEKNLDLSCIQSVQLNLCQNRNWLEIEWKKFVLFWEEFCNLFEITWIWNEVQRTVMTGFGSTEKVSKRTLFSSSVLGVSSQLSNIAYILVVTIEFAKLELTYSTAFLTTIGWWSRKRSSGFWY